MLPASSVTFHPPPRYRVSNSSGLQFKPGNNMKTRRRKPVETAPRDTQAGKSHQLIAILADPGRSVIRLLGGPRGADSISLNQETASDEKIQRYI
jgi:hypothetical protein